MTCRAPVDHLAAMRDEYHGANDALFFHGSSHDGVESWERKRYCGGSRGQSRGERGRGQTQPSLVFHVDASLHSGMANAMRGR